MALAELRREWEKGWEVALVVPVKIGGFAKVFVILRKVVEGRGTANPKLNFCVHRYFKVGDEWTVSVDLQMSTYMEACVSVLNEDKDLKDLYEEVEWS